MASSINASTSGGGGIITTADATGNLNIQSGGSTVFAVTSTGATVTGTLAATGASTFTGTGKFATTIGVGNATPAASGSGITFPATQSASSDANTLDDYEEGTFTPTMSGATGGPVTLSTATGQYTKIGNVVNFRLRVTVSNANSAGGAININGLPFTCSATISCRNRVISADISNFTGNTMDTIGGTFIANSGTSISMLNSTFVNVVLTNTSSADVTGTYFTA